jgi:hypothetical protein
VHTDNRRAHRVCEIVICTCDRSAIVISRCDVCIECWHISLHILHHYSIWDKWCVFNPKCCVIWQKSSRRKLPTFCLSVFSCIQAWLLICGDILFSCQQIVRYNPSLLFKSLKLFSSEEKWMFSLDHWRLVLLFNVPI